MTGRLLLVLAAGIVTLATSGVNAVEPRTIDSLKSNPTDAPTEPAEMARRIDQMIAELQGDQVKRSPVVDDGDFIRRVSLDLAGRLPEPDDVIRFGLSDSPDRRQKLINELLDSSAYARNWSRYWRDVIFSRSTNMRAGFAIPQFEQWMEQQLASNMSWDQIATELMTATGDVTENGAAALIYAQEGKADDVAAEASRIFLGIQLQCANCHDHPWDDWKREEFHELAAFFPRISIRPVRDEDRLVSYEVVSVRGTQGRNNPGALLSSPFMFRRLDRNGDGKIARSEVQEKRLQQLFERIVGLADKNGDRQLTRAELASFEPPMQAGRGSLEHVMPNLENPTEPGTRTAPVFFLDGTSGSFGMSDSDRRELLATKLTSSENAWFARAFVNRMWSELMGQGFYMPIDDMGPERSATLPEVLDLLSAGFVRSGYDVKWLLAAVTNTDAYQRQLGKDTSDQATAPFAHAEPTRLRSDQLFDVTMQVLGANEATQQSSRRYAGPAQQRRSPRVQFNQIFGFDPSTPQSDLNGSIPQALLLMNSQQLNGAIDANGNTRLGRLLRRYDDDEDALRELYLLVLVRDPSEKEIGICQKYIAKVGDREEAFEDLMWSLLNSTEFQTRR